MANHRSKPDPTDLDIGKRIRLQRLAKKMSQTELGTRIGVTFQQIQKYEKGTNRVSPGRLTRVAEVLDIPVTAFFAKNRATSETIELSYLVVPGAIDLVKAYSQIKESNVRRAVLDLVEAVSKDS